MDFFERQEQARQNSARLTPMLALAVLGVLPAVYLLALLIITVASGITGFWSSVFVESQTNAVSSWKVNTDLWRPGLFGVVTGVTLLVIFWSSARKIRQLAGGGRVVAEFLGATRLNPRTTDLNERRLINVVEEMSIASGSPVPEIYILRREPGLNAFVAGHSANDMVVAVTEGCVKYLSRDELQGVIAHEYSHLLNGDMAVNMRLMGLVHGLFSITLLSYWVMEQTHDEEERSMEAQPMPPGPFKIVRDLGILVVGFVLAFIGFIGALAGRMVKSAVAREREYLADASAVQFTRNPEGLASALKKAKIWPEGTLIHSIHTEEASHIYFNNGMDEDHGTLTATHPPLEERIRRVENMMGRAFTPEPKIEVPPQVAITPPPPSRRPAQPSPFDAQEPKLPPVSLVAPAAVMASVGVPTGLHLQYVSRLIENLPPALATAARDPKGAWGLLCALLLDETAGIRAEQLRIVQARSGEDIQARTQALAAELGKLDPAGKLPLVELAITGLRQLSKEEHDRFMQTVQQLIRADHRIALFELALHKMLVRRLVPAYKSVPPVEVRIHSLSALRHDCAALLSAAAHAGQDSPEAAASAFQLGVKHLEAGSMEFRCMPRGECTVNLVEAALNNIAEAGPRLKKQILGACVQTVAADGVIQIAEAELLRAIADTLDCPIPPFVAEGQ
jgi:Zn-dependent protease with chaperone function